MDVRAKVLGPFPTFRDYLVSDQCWMDESDDVADRRRSERTPHGNDRTIGFSVIDREMDVSASPSDQHGAGGQAAPKPTLPGRPSTVSVLIPVYNGAALVNRAVASVLGQNYPLEELLLLDDGSTDSSAELLREMSRSNPSIRVLQNAGNRGLAQTLNRGLREIRGEVVLVLHQDCGLLGNGWFGRAMASFADPTVFSVVPSPHHDTGEMTALERQFWVLRHHMMDEVAPSGRASRHTLFSENKCDLFRRDQLLALGGFDPRLPEGGEDQVLAWRLRHTGFRVVREPSLQFSITLGSGGGLRTHLRKEGSYGRQMRQVVLLTRFGALHRSPGVPRDPRLVNRGAGVLWILAGLVGLVLLVGTREPWFWLVAFVPPILRWIQLVSRGFVYRRAYHLSLRHLLGLGPIGLLADLAYALGLVTPARRARRGPTDLPAA